MVKCAQKLTKIRPLPTHLEAGAPTIAVHLLAEHRLPHEVIVVVSAIPSLTGETRPWAMVAIDLRLPLDRAKGGEDGKGGRNEEDEGALHC